MDRTLGQMVKAKLYRKKSHIEAYTNTLTKRGKGGKIIYLAPKVHLLNLGWFVVYSGILQMQVHQVVCGDSICCTCSYMEKFPFLFFAQLPGLSFGFGPAYACRSPEGVCSRPDRRGLKEQLIRGLWLTQSGVREGYGCGASLRQQRPPWHCTSLRCRAFSHGSCSWITGPWY